MRDGQDECEAGEVGMGGPVGWDERGEHGVSSLSCFFRPSLVDHLWVYRTLKGYGHALDGIPSVTGKAERSFCSFSGFLSLPSLPHLAHLPMSALSTRFYRLSSVDSLSAPF